MEYTTRRPTPELVHAISQSRQGRNQLEAAYDAMEALFFRAKNAIHVETVHYRRNDQSMMRAGVVDHWSTGQRTEHSTLSQILLNVLPSTVITDTTQVHFSAFQHFRMDAGIQKSLREQDVIKKATADWSTRDTILYQQLHGVQVADSSYVMIPFTDKIRPYGVYHALRGSEDAPLSARIAKVEEWYSTLTRDLDFQTLSSMVYMFLDAQHVVVPYHTAAHAYIKQRFADYPGHAVHALWLRILHISLVMDAALQTDRAYGDTSTEWKAAMVQYHLPSVREYVDMLQQMDNLLFVPDA